MVLRRVIVGAFVIAGCVGIGAVEPAPRAAAADPFAVVTYHGGHTIQHAKIVGVRWGAGTLLPEVQATKPRVDRDVAGHGAAPVMAAD